jgi:hypothetical protein
MTTKQKFALIIHGRQTERVGTFDTLKKAKAATTAYEPHPVCEAKKAWVDHPAIYRTDGVIRHRTVWRSGTSNPHVGLAIWELEADAKEQICICRLKFQPK